MNRKYLGLAMLAALLGTVALAAAEENAIFRAMKDELARSMERLSIENMPRPYFMSYRVEDQDQLTVEARYGALTQSRHSNSRVFYAEVRVGDPNFDNTSFLGSWQDVFNMREDLVEEPDYDALRHQIWLITDEAYKNALEQLARKRAYLQTHPSGDTLADFSAADKVEHFEDPVTLAADVAAWENDVHAAADALTEFGGLEDWTVEYTARALNRRFLNSEGSRHLKGAYTQSLEVSATIQAADGERLTGFLRYIVRGNDNPPTGDDLLKAVRKLGEDLTTAAAAPRVDEYAGPVLFTDYAAAQLVGQLFAAQLSPVREFLTAEDWMKQMLPQGKLSERLNRRVLPEFITITDRPDLKEWKGRELLCYNPVDDEGVTARTITLVDKGRLVALPMGRQPTKKFSHSNGHARALPNQWTQPTATNLFVKSTETLPPKQLVERLRKLAKDFDNEYGLMITLLNDDQVADRYSWVENNRETPEPLTAPVLAYKVYAADGRIEPVRGLRFDEATVRSLRDIGVTGTDDRVYSLWQPAVVSQFSYSLSVETPSILVEEMELKADPAQEPLPISRSPFSSK